MSLLFYIFHTLGFASVFLFSCEYIRARIAQKIITTKITDYEVAWFLRA